MAVLLVRKFFLFLFGIYQTMALCGSNCGSATAEIAKSSALTQLQERFKKTYRRTVTTEQMGRIFLTADQHFFHDKVIPYSKRPHENINAMNAAMVAAHNATVGTDDEVWFIGDVTMRPLDLEKTVKPLNGRKILFLGNHDMPHPKSMNSSHHRRDIEELPRLLDIYRRGGFDEIHLGGEVTLPDGSRINISHYPYHEAFDGKPAPLYQLRNDGKPLLSGHVHENWKTKGRMINIGVDVRNFTPVSLQQLLPEISNLPIATPTTEEIPTENFSNSIDYTVFEVSPNNSTNELFQILYGTTAEWKERSDYGEKLYIDDKNGRKLLHVWLPRAYPAYEELTYYLYSHFTMRLRHSYLVSAKCSINSRNSLAEYSAANFFPSAPTSLTSREGSISLARRSCLKPPCENKPSMYCFIAASITVASAPL